MDYKCITHNITLTIEGDRRDFQTPEGSMRGLPACKLLTMPEPTEGQHGNCQIEKVS